MSLNHNSQIVADVRVHSLTGRVGIGLYQLVFSVVLTFPAWSSPGVAPRLRNLRAKILAGAEQGPRHLLGVALPEGPISLYQSAFSKDEQLGLELNLTPEQIDALEKLRGGGGIQFECVFQSETEGPQGIARAEERVVWTANLSIWSVALAQLNLKDVVLVAVELPKRSAGDFGRAAIESLRRAKQDLAAGDYGAVVGRCRLALESIKVGKTVNRSENVSAPFEKFQKSRRSMSKRERQDLITEALRHYAHLAHHVDDNGHEEWYSMSDATFALAIAAAVVSVEIKEQEARMDAQP